MIRIQLSKLLGEKRLTQADIARMTGIRAGTINDLYHEIATRISLEHLDLLCETLLHESRTENCPLKLEPDQL